MPAASGTSSRWRSKTLVSESVSKLGSEPPHAARVGWLSRLVDRVYSIVLVVFAEVHHRNYGRTCPHLAALVQIVPAPRLGWAAISLSAKAEPILAVVLLAEELEHAYARQSVDQYCDLFMRACHPQALQQLIQIKAENLRDPSAAARAASVVTCSPAPTQRTQSTSRDTASGSSRDVWASVATCSPAPARRRRSSNPATVCGSLTEAWAAGSRSSSFRWSEVVCGQGRGRTADLPLFRRSVADRKTIRSMRLRARLTCIRADQEVAAAV